MCFPIQIVFTKNFSRLFVLTLHVYKIKLMRISKTLTAKQYFQKEFLIIERGVEGK